MRADEAVVFSIYDNAGSSRLAHSALDLACGAETLVPRKSIESRALVRYS